MKRENSSPLAHLSQKKPVRNYTDNNITVDRYWPEYQRPTVTVREVPYESETWKELARIRTEVFVEEQNVTLEGEYDGLDPDCVHLGLIKNGEYIGTCRLRLKHPFVKLERVCIIKSMRGNGYAELLCRNAGRTACEKWPECLLVAHAQSYSLGLYQKIGAMIVGPEFMEEDIRHQTIAFLFRHQFAVGDYIPPENHSGLGIEDPDTVENIKKILILIMECRIAAPLDIFSIVAPYTHETGLWLQNLTEYMVLVCTLNPSEFVASRDKMLENEKKLIDMVKHKLYVGHYSDVQKHWRYFAYAVYLLISIYHFPNFKGTEEFFNRRKALEHLDLALCFGEKRTGDNEFITKRCSIIKETLPLIELELTEKVHKPIPKLISNSVPIEVTGIISDEVFMDTYLFKRKPVLIKGAAQMKAVKSWTLANLAKTLSGRTFPVEQGSRYTDDDWTQGFMSAEDFFEAVKDSERAPVYLAQHRLLDQVPELFDYVEVPVYCKATGLRDEDVEINAWIGPAGTISPLHQDPKDNIFCQLNGKKFFRLIDPAFSAYLYPVGGEMHSNTSQVDVENPDFDLFPNFAQVECVDAVVEEGDLLYIPQGWFHYVKSLTPSSSLSFWFDPHEK